LVTNLGSENDLSFSFGLPAKYAQEPIAAVKSQPTINTAAGIAIELSITQSPSI
jgi:hypothetical protein